MRSCRHLDSHLLGFPSTCANRKEGEGGFPWRVALCICWGGGRGQLQASVAQGPFSQRGFQDAVSSVLARLWFEGPVKGEAQNCLWAGRWLPVKTWPEIRATIWVQSSLSLLHPGLRRVQTPCQRGNNSNGSIQRVDDQ